MLNIKTIADDADIIVNGYAFNRYENGYRVLNLHRSDKAAVFSQEGEVLETSMDDIELSIVSDYLRENTWRIKMPKYYEFKVAGYSLEHPTAKLEIFPATAPGDHLFQDGPRLFFCRYSFGVRPNFSRKIA